jgi:hypothetical protein
VFEPRTELIDQVPFDPRSNPISIFFLITYISQLLSPRTMMDEGAFSFEDVEDGSSPPRVTAPLPGAPSLTYPRPGTLFGGSPRPVASGVTRGEKKEETRVRLLHVSDPATVCGGVTGAVENKKFCAAHPSLC